MYISLPECPEGVFAVYDPPLPELTEPEFRSDWYTSRGATYNWEVLGDGETHVISPVVQYSNSPHRVKRRIYQWASDNRKKVNIVTHGIQSDPACVLEVTMTPR